MLRELHIANLAVIEDAAIDLRGGLNCFTGQTGAGKSLVIGAIEAMLGLRPANDMLRGGCDEGRVSGVFELRNPLTVRRINEAADAGLDEAAVEAGGSEQLLITRKVFSSGRTSVAINGRPATTGMLRTLAELLVDVHGQHDHQHLLKPSNQLEMLDRFAGCDTQRQRYASLHRNLAELADRRAELEASEELRRQQLELYEFQADEIDAAEPTEGEYEELASRQKLLSNLAKVRQDATVAGDALSDSEGSVLERLSAVVGLLRQLAELDEDLTPVAESVREATARVQDASFDLSRYVSRIDLDPQELAEVTDRLNTLNRIIHKYGEGRGGTLDQVIAFRNEIAEKIDRLRGESDEVEGIDTAMQPLRDEMQTIAVELHEARSKAAERIKVQVEAELGELGMADAVLDIGLRELDGESSEGRASATGLDAVEVMIAANPGQPSRPLRKVASGGELSRIMLAIKSIAAGSDRISVLVFDEIDANIGGRMGAVIGSKLKGLGASHQVLCITHLPQIAAYADHHLKISKDVEGGETVTRVGVIEGAARVEELAEMMSGSRVTDTTRKQVEEMMRMAEAGGVIAHAEKAKKGKAKKDNKGGVDVVVKAKAKTVEPRSRGRRKKVATGKSG